MVKVFFRSLAVAAVAFSLAVSAKAATIDIGELKGGAPEVLTEVRSGAFTDRIEFNITSDHTLLSSVQQIGLGELLNIDSLIVSLLDISDNTLASGPELATPIASGSYVLEIQGTADGSLGGVYGAALAVVPLPPAAWLFGAALVGFAAVSRRRRGEAV